MSKIVLSKGDKRLNHPSYGIYHSHEYIACDLARPAAELEALAHLMSGVSWLGDTLVQDAVLYFHDDHDVPFALQERSLHKALSIAREVLSEALARLPEAARREAPEPQHTDDIYSATYTKESGRWTLPKGTSGPTFLLVDESAGLTGYFICNAHYYDDKARPLAAALLSLLLPEAGIQRCQKQSYSEIPVGRRVEGLRDAGAACLREAQAMILTMKQRLNALQLEGRPSAFTDEDDDARDVLLELMAAGATITRTRREDAEYRDIDGVFDYVLDDGTTLPVHVVERLKRAGTIRPEDGRYGNSPTLVAAPALTAADLSPRSDAVSFDAFQSYCTYRRHPDDGETECVHRKHHGYNSYCTGDDCPLLRQVYEREYGDSFERVMSEDPAFEDHLLDEARDPLMEPLHDNTRRSYAWQAAGQGRMMGVVNQVLGSYLAYGIPMLLEKIHVRAVDEAAAAGWLEVVERNDLGVISRPTRQLLDTYAQQQTEIAAARAQSEAAQKERTDA